MNINYINENYKVKYIIGTNVLSISVYDGSKLVLNSKHNDSYIVRGILCIITYTNINNEQVVRTINKEMWLVWQLNTMRLYITDIKEQTNFTFSIYLWCNSYADDTEDYIYINLCKNISNKTKQKFNSKFTITADEPLQNKVSKYEQLLNIQDNTCLGFYLNNFYTYNITFKLVDKPINDVIVHNTTDKTNEIWLKIPSNDNEFEHNNFILHELRNYYGLCTMSENKIAVQIIDDDSNLNIAHNFNIGGDSENNIHNIPIILFPYYCNELFARYHEFTDLSFSYPLEYETPDSKYRNIKTCYLAANFISTKINSDKSVYDVNIDAMVIDKDPTPDNAKVNTQYNDCYFGNNYNF